MATDALRTCEGDVTPKKVMVDRTRQMKQNKLVLPCSYSGFYILVVKLDSDRIAMEVFGGSDPTKHIHCNSVLQSMSIVL